MSKNEKQIQKEIYDFIEDEMLEKKLDGIVLQVILNNFCDKYKVSEPTIQRHLDKMITKKSPFRLRTWYDKNRYYGIPTVSISFQFYFAMTLIVPVVMFIVGTMLSFSISMFEASLLFFAGIWISYIIERKKNKNGKNI